MTAPAGIYVTGCSTPTAKAGGGVATRRDVDIRVLVGDSEVSRRFQLDTGADFTVVSPDVAQHLGLNARADGWALKPLRTAGGPLLARIGLIPIRLPTEAAYFPIRVGVLETRERNIQLLGRDGVLTQFIVVLHPAGGCSLLRRARFSLRVRVCTPCVIAFGSSRISGETLNLSEGGLLVVTAERLVVGTDVEIALQPVGSALVGRVVDSTSTADGWHTRLALLSSPTDYATYVRDRIAAAGVD